MAAVLETASTGEMAAILETVPEQIDYETRGYYREDIDDVKVSFLHFPTNIHTYRRNLLAG